METIESLLLLALINILAIISPGQSFAVIVKVSLTTHRNYGIVAALGMGVGSAIWAGAVFGGLAILLKQHNWIQTTLEIASAIYLLGLALIIFKHAKDKPIEIKKHYSFNLYYKAFFLGLFTQLANPKVIVFFGSIILVFLPDNPSVWFYVCALIIIFFNETTWYSLVSIMFSKQNIRVRYNKFKRWIDYLTAIILATIAGALIINITSIV